MGFSHLCLGIIFFITTNALFWTKSRDEENKTNEGLCFPDVGCFPITNEFFNPILRPLNVNPQNPEEINTTFWLYTQKNPQEPFLISSDDKQSIDESNFNKQNPVIFICHGFTDKHDSGWIREMASALFEIKDVNVIAVDWSFGAVFPYTVAVANTRVVGKQIANMVSFFEENYGVKLTDVHIIGHSLGGQIAGYAGEALNGTVGRITGLDPAAFFYQGMPKSVILDLRDAKFVDVVHTDSHPVPYVGLGTPEAHGHFDFYPDGGRKIKACNFQRKIKAIFQEGLNGLLRFLSCSHSMAVTLYTQSINGTCPFTAYTCDSIESYEEGKCMNCEKPGHDCAPMGYHSVEYFDGENVLKNFYLTTSEDDSKLCVIHWILEIESGSTLESPSNSPVTMQIEIKAENDGMDKSVTKSVELQPDETYRQLLEYGDQPGKIESLEFSWDASEGGENFKLRLKKISLIPIDIIDQNERKQQTLEFCSSELNEGVEKRVKVTLRPNTNC